jgi:hypothetical protein
MAHRGADHWAWEFARHQCPGMTAEDINALGEWIANAMQSAIDRHVRDASRDCAIASPSSEASPHD